MKSLTPAWFACLLLLSACGSNTTVKTGPSVYLGPITISAYIDNTGTVTLDQAYSLVVGDKDLGASWDVAFETTLNEAKDNHYTLYILYRYKNGEIIQDEYAINRPFEINFNNDQWVKKIVHDDNSNIVVYVEPNPLSATPTIISESTVSFKTDTAQAPSATSNPDKFIRRYYRALSDGNYETSWSMLTQNFKNKYNNTGYGPYRDWWNTVSRVEILSIDDQSVESQSFYLVVELAYYYKNGQVDTYDQMGFNLIWDNSVNDWKIDDAQLLKGTK